MTWGCDPLPSRGPCGPHVWPTSCSCARMRTQHNARCSMVKLMVFCHLLPIGPSLQKQWFSALKGLHWFEHVWTPTTLRLARHLSTLSFKFKVTTKTLRQGQGQDIKESRWTPRRHKRFKIFWVTPPELQTTLDAVFNRQKPWKRCTREEQKSRINMDSNCCSSASNDARILSSKKARGLHPAHMPAIILRQAKNTFHSYLFRSFHFISFQGQETTAKSITEAPSRRDLHFLSTIGNHLKSPTLS